MILLPNCPTKFAIVDNVSLLLIVEIVNSMTICQIRSLTVDIRIKSVYSTVNLYMRYRNKSKFTELFPTVDFAYNSSII